MLAPFAWVKGLRERRQRSDAALNRAKIIDAARRLLADDQDPSMREIAAAAEPGTRHGAPALLHPR